MTYKNFLVPVSAVLAALLPAKLQAAPVSLVDQIPNGSTSDRSPSTMPSTTIVQNTLEYKLDSELHKLILRKDEAGILSAGHGSHASHASHASHRSGY